MSWTVQRVETLKQRWNDGAPASEIAAELGDITRNAVIGKAHRLGLAGRCGSASGARIAATVGERRPVERQSGVNRSRIKSLRGQERQEQADERRAQFSAVEIVELPPEQSATAVRFMDLESHHCRYPLGDPRNFDAMRFCGAQASPDRPYCPHHCVLAYQPRARLHD